jgi:hypothetical protein
MCCIVLGIKEFNMSNPGTTDLQCWWKLNENSGTRYDQMNRVDLLQTGGVGSKTGHQTFSSKCANFVAASSQYLTADDPFDLLQGGNFPICIGFWIRLHNVGLSPVLVSKWGGGPEEYEIVIIGSKVRFAINDANSVIYTVDSDTFGTLSNNVWYFIGVYFDSVANEIGVGVNDEWDTTAVGIYGIDADTADFIVGTYVPLTSFLDGYIDEMFFYSNRLLDNDEWTWLYNSGYGRRYEDVSQLAPPTVDVVTDRKIPEIYVYDQDLDALGIIDEYSSLNWAERYNSEGDFELELPLSYASSSLLTFGNFLYIPTSDKLMIVEEKKPTRSPTEGKLIVNGRSAESVLRRRVQMQEHTWFAPAEFIAYHHVYWSSINPADNDRKIDLFESGSGDGWPPAMETSSTIIEQFASETIYEIIEIVLKRVDLGFKIIVGNLANPASKLYFLVYEGVDRSLNQQDITPPIIFSEVFDNLLNSSFITTQKDKINTTQVVISDDPTYERVFVWEGGSDETPGGTEPSGLDRFEGRLETTIDRGEGPDDPSGPAPTDKPTLGTVGKVNLIAIGITTTPTMGLKSDITPPLTDKEVLDMIEERGEAVIKENTPLAVFDGDADARGQFVIGEDFFLGDIVQVDSHGNSGPARVVEVVKSYSVEGEKIYIAFDFEV